MLNHSILITITETYIKVSKGLLNIVIHLEPFAWSHWIRNDLLFAVLMSTSAPYYLRQKKRIALEDS